MWTEPAGVGEWLSPGSEFLLLLGQVPCMQAGESEQPRVLPLSHTPLALPLSAVSLLCTRSLPDVQS